MLNFAIKLAKEAGEIILKESKKALKIDKKGLNDLVTNADTKAETYIIKKIKSSYPSHAILAEESSFKKEISDDNYKKADYIWIIDPLDGTTNFAHSLPLYSVSIGLFKKTSIKSSKNFDYLEGEIIAGVVHAPALNETFSAQKNKGAFLNGKKIGVSKAKSLRDSLMVTGFPYENKKMNLPYFIIMMDHCQAIRRLGSAALDLCYTAAGRFDGYWEFGLKPWDIAAGSLILKEAGGTVTDVNGNMLDLFGADILVSNGKIHKEIIKLFSKIQ